MIQRTVSPGKDRIDPETPREQGARKAQANGARLWAKPQSQRTRTGYCARTAQRVGASGPAAAGPSDTAAFRIRSATVGKAPVAADANGILRSNGSARRSVRACCGWSVGHSRAPLYPFCASFAHVSLSVIVRLKIGWPGRLSFPSTQK